MTATIDAKSAEGESFQIVLEKRGADTGRIQTRQWAAGRDPNTAPPDDERTIDVRDVRVDAAGDRLTCNGRLVFRVDIACTVNGPVGEKAPSVHVLARTFVGPVLDGSYDLSLGEHQELTDFIRDSGFPVTA